MKAVQLRYSHVDFHSKMFQVSTKKRTKRQKRTDKLAEEKRLFQVSNDLVNIV